MSICSSFRAFHPRITHKLHLRKPIRFAARFISITPYYSPSSSSKTKSPETISPFTPVCVQSMEQLPPKLQNIIRLFDTVRDPRAKYEQLLYYGKQLSPMAEQYKTPENKVQGCVSQVWVRAFLDEEKRNVFFEADSDSGLTKGLAALLVEAFSGHPPSDIVGVSPEFIQMLGLKQSLTPSRNNGFLNMLKLMQRKALELFMESQGVSTREGGASPADNSGMNGGLLVDDKGEDVNPEPGEDGDDGEACPLLGRADRIREKLMRGLDPVDLDIEDYSHAHAGHVGSRVSRGGETHFNLKIVSKEFEGKSLIKRHRLIYDLLQDEMEAGLHAISIDAKTPSEVDGR
ncbi:unnamed protein product [Victoria cruziana]